MIIESCGVVVQLDERRVLVIVGRRPVVVIRMVVVEVLVHVQKGAHGARRDQGLGEHEGNQPPHDDSLLLLMCVPGSASSFLPAASA